MAIAAHTCSLYITSTTASGTFAAEPCHSVAGTGATSDFQVTDDNKQVVVPTSTVTAADGGVAAPVDTVDYLFGVVDLTSTPGGAVTLTGGNYYTMVSAGTSTDFSLSFSTDVLDTTTIDAGAFRKKVSALIDLSGSMTLLEAPNQDYDPGAGTAKLADIMMDGSPKVLEFRLGGTEAVRAWVLIESYENGATVDGLVETSVSFVGADQIGTAAQTVATGGTAWLLSDTDLS